jgi:hypothetical protein
MSTITALQSTDDGAASRAIINTNFTNLNTDKVETSSIVRAYKSTNETINNSSTFQNDDHLFFSIAANEAWAFTIFFIFTSEASAAADRNVKYRLVAPAGANILMHGDWYQDAAGDGEFFNPFVKQAFGGPERRADVLTGHVINGSTGGTVNFQWAQNAANAFNTTAHTGSYLIAHRLA